jgi:hypothetical protein
MVSSDDFADRVCSRIWAAVERLARSRQPIGFDEVVREMHPNDVLEPDGSAFVKVLGPDGRYVDLSLPESVRETIDSASGTAQEAVWCALRVRAQSLRNSLLNLTILCEQALIGGRSKEAKDLFAEARKLADSYREADLKASRELRRLQGKAGI